MSCASAAPQGARHAAGLRDTTRSARSARSATAEARTASARGGAFVLAVTAAAAAYSAGRAVAGSLPPHAPDWNSAAPGKPAAGGDVASSGMPGNAAEFVDARVAAASAKARADPVDPRALAPLLAAGAAATPDRAASPLVGASAPSAVVVTSAVRADIADHADGADRAVAADARATASHRAPPFERIGERAADAADRPAFADAAAARPAGLDAGYAAGPRRSSARLRVRIEGRRGCCERCDARGRRGSAKSSEAMRGNPGLRTRSSPDAESSLVLEDAPGARPGARRSARGAARPPWKDAAHRDAGR